MKHFSLSNHAVARYRQRVHPCLTTEQARRDLCTRVAAAPEPEGEHPQVELGDGAFAVLARKGQHWVVLTCVERWHGGNTIMRDALADAGLVEAA